MEKVIKAFEFCLMPPSKKEIEDDICSHEDCPYYREYNGGKCISAAASDALALLKAQEPVTVIPAIKKNDELLTEGICPICGAKLDYYLNGQFCGCCGRRLKWE